jgi:Domain of unknown function (DUF4192)
MDASSAGAPSAVASRGTGATGGLAYVRGDGSLAGTAVQAALVDDVEHPMAGMLDTALQDAVRPEEIRELLVPAGRRRRGLRRAPTRLRNSRKRAQPT